MKNKISRNSSEVQQKQKHFSYHKHPESHVINWWFECDWFKTPSESWVFECLLVFGCFCLCCLSGWPHTADLGSDKAHPGVPSLHWQCVTLEMSSTHDRTSTVLHRKRSGTRTGVTQDFCTARGKSKLDLRSVLNLRCSLRGRPLQPPFVRAPPALPCSFTKHKSALQLTRKMAAEAARREVADLNSQSQSLCKKAAVRLRSQFNAV